MRIVIIIPTYNEAATTPRLVHALARVISSLKTHSISVLYVDGASPDGTAQIILHLQSTYQWLHLLAEDQRKGLGVAYAHGMQHAIRELEAEYILEFDGDGQHRPEDIPLLISQISAGYDYVIGSRFVPGGSIPEAWGFSRRFLSMVGNLVARVVLGIFYLHDVTAGFKLSKVKGFLDCFNFRVLLSNRHAYKIHLLHYMLKSGARVIEVPVQFLPREEGETKLIKNDIIDTLRVVFMLRIKDWFRIGTNRRRRWDSMPLTK